MNQTSKKYKINSYLLSLPISDYRRAIHIIPQALGISLNTFHNYRNIGLYAKQDIPYVLVMRLEFLFDMEAGFLFNGEVKQLPLKNLLKREFLPKISKKQRLNKS